MVFISSYVEALNADGLFVRVCKAASRADGRQLKVLPTPFVPARVHSVSSQREITCVINRATIKQLMAVCFVRWGEKLGNYEFTKLHKLRAGELEQH